MTEFKVLELAKRVNNSAPMKIFLQPLSRSEDHSFETWSHPDQISQDDS